MPVGYQTAPVGWLGQEPFFGEDPSFWRLALAAQWDDGSAVDGQKVDGQKVDGAKADG